MTIPYFLVIALVAIFQFVTVDLTTYIHLWKAPFADSDKAMPITRNTSVYLQCSKFPEPMNTQWTFIRPGGRMLVTTFSASLTINTFNKSHVGNYQCRVFPSSGPEIWRSITLCMAKYTGKVPTSDDILVPTCSEKSRSSWMQVIKFNRLQKSDEPFKLPNSEILDLKELKNVKKTINRMNTRLECPFEKEKNDSLIWMVDSTLDYKQLKKYNDGSINILNVDRKGRYDCLVGNSSGYMRYRFVVKADPLVIHVTAGPTAVDGTANHKDIDVGLMVSIPCVVFLVFAATGALIFFLRRSKRGPIRKHIPSPQPHMAVDMRKRHPSHLDVFDAEEVSQSVKTRSESDVRTSEEFDCKTYENTEYTPWKLRPDNLKLVDILRENNSYTLYCARLVNLLPELSVNVVVKMSKAGTTDNDLLDLLTEMKIMKSVGKHANVVSLIGTCDQTDALFFVMEFAEHGNLRDYLRERGSSLGYEYTHESESECESLSVHIDLVSYAHQVAIGMEYLTSRGCVHKGLQAKRVLISKGGILKIADYATKRKRREDFQAVARDNNQLAVRWMAPETLFRGIHTTEANVWSFGILLWEIMTFAATPYPLILTTEELAARLKLGYYMENPKGCPKDIYKLMRRCWNENPARRPRFDQLVEDLQEMLWNFSDQSKRLESDYHQQEEYADPMCAPWHKLNDDSQYDDVIHVISREISPS